MEHKCGLKIMIVDDNESITAVIGGILERQGYSVVTYSDSLEALKAFELAPTDVVLCDVEMPRLNGMDLMAKMKTISPDTSIAVITGYGDTYTLREALLIGADEYILKPFKSDELIMVMERLRWRHDKAKQMKSV